MKPKIRYDYDDEADVMYISLGKPKKAITKEFGNFGVHYDKKTKKFVGVTIVGFSEIAKKKNQ